MIETKQGLPNTCSACGQPAGETWWAENQDVARSGGGLCATCARQAPKKRAPDAISAEAAAQAEAERVAAEAGMSAEMPAASAAGTAQKADGARRPGDRRARKE